HHRPVSGIVVAENLIVAPARALADDTASVRLADGATVEGAVLGHALAAGIAVVRVPGLAAPPLSPAGDPRVGHLAIAVGRTWSGGVMATVTNVAVVGGPLQTGRASQLERVIRITQAPHGALTGGALIDGEGRALGAITGSAIRGTTVVVPASLAWPLAQQVVQQGGTRQGFIGISSSTVALPERQRSGRAQEYGLLVNTIVDQSPADAAGFLVGDIIVAFDGQAVQEPEALVTLLRGDRVGKAVPLTILRGAELRDVAVTIGDRPRRERRAERHRR
ncbi:MAG: S1C family serine protease, partial [Vicinamibacterales bacterium]